VSGSGDHCLLDHLMAPRKKFLLRIDQALWDELEAWAKDELRSVNGQVEYVLRDAVVRRRGAHRLKQHPRHPPSAAG
jgi:hypothetical protein